MSESAPEGTQDADRQDAVNQSTGNDTGGGAGDAAGVPTAADQVAAREADAAAAGDGSAR